MDDFKKSFIFLLSRPPTHNVPSYFLVNLFGFHLSFYLTSLVHFLMFWLCIIILDILWNYPTITSHVYFNLIYQGCIKFMFCFYFLDTNSSIGVMSFWCIKWYMKPCEMKKIWWYKGNLYSKEHDFGIHKTSN